MIAEVKLREPVSSQPAEPVRHDGTDHPPAAWGIVGEIRFDDAPANARGCLDMDRFGGGRRWRSPGERAAAVCWGGRGGDLHFIDDRGLVVLADATLYEPARLAAQLGLDPGEGDSARLLAAAYLRWGADMCAHLDGDYAFVVCDLRAATAFAAVDPMGVRPLFYRHEPGKSFAFSSRDDLLATWIGLDPRIPESRLLEPLLNLEELRHFRSDVPGLATLQAAHACRADGNDLRMWRYWTAGERRPDIAEHDIGAWIEGLRTHLHSAVRKRMADGARIGVMFSGGLDSASVLALATRIAPAGEITAYSLLDRSRPDCPETRAIDRTIAATGARLVSLDIADMQAHVAPSLHLLARVPRFNFVGNGFLPCLCTTATEAGVGAMMNGYDADSLFDEADLLQRRLRQGQYRRMLHEARRLDRGLGIADVEPQVRRLRMTQWLPAWMETRLRAIWRRSREGNRLRGFLLDRAAAQRLHLRERLREYRALTKRTQDGRGPALPASLMQIPTVIDGVARSELRCRFGAMQMRSPFLDRDLIDFAAWIPLELRMRNGRTKWILRKAMNPYLPHEVTWRGDKLHLGSHYARVLLRPVLNGVLRDFAGSGPAIAPYVDRKGFEAQAQRWLDGDIEAVWALSSWLALEHWLQHNHDRVAWGQ